VNTTLRTARKHFEALAHAAAALSDPKRIEVMYVLQERAEATVTDLVEATGLSQPMVSKALGVLEKAQMVDCRRDGRWKFYSKAATHGEDLLRACVQLDNAEAETNFVNSVLLGPVLFMPVGV